MPSPSVTYTFTNGTTSDATQVNQNFTDLVNAMTDGTKDFSIANLTASGTLTFSGLTASRLASTNASKQLASNASLTANGFAYPDGTGSLASTAATTNGQILIGATSAAPTAGTLTGTANQITITNAANSITISLPAALSAPGTLAVAGATTINSSIAFSEKLGVAGSTNNSGVVRIENAVNSTDVNHGILNLVNTATYAVGNDAKIMFSFKGIGGGSGTIDPAASMGAVCEGAALAYQAALVWNTRSAAGSYSEKMRLSSGGNLSVTGITTATGGVTFGNSSPTNLNAYQEGTFTATITGCTTSPTGTATYTLVGKKVTLILPAITATSNSTAFTYTGLPAAIQTVTTQRISLNQAHDAAAGAGSSSAGFTYTAQISASGTITFLMGNSATGWTNSAGTKGLDVAQTISYTLQ